MATAKLDRSREGIQSTGEEQCLAGDSVSGWVLLRLGVRGDQSEHPAILRKPAKNPFNQRGERLQASEVGHW